MKITTKQREILLEEIKKEEKEKNKERAKDLIIEIQKRIIKQYRVFNKDLIFWNWILIIMLWIMILISWL